MQGQNTDAENQNEYAVISIKTSPIPNYSNQKKYIQEFNCTINRVIIKK